MIELYQAELGSLKGTVVEMEQTLSTCNEDFARIPSKIANLTSIMTKLENKCEDLEVGHAKQDCGGPGGSGQ